MNIHTQEYDGELAYCAGCAHLRRRCAVVVDKVQGEALCQSEHVARIACAQAQRRCQPAIGLCRIHELVQREGAGCNAARSERSIAQARLA